MTDKFSKEEIEFVRNKSIDGRLLVSMNENILDIAKTTAEIKEHGISQDLRFDRIEENVTTLEQKYRTCPARIDKKEARIVKKKLKKLYLLIGSVVTAIGTLVAYLKGLF